MACRAMRDALAREAHSTSLNSFRFPAALHLPSCKWWQQATLCQ
jgi:hypothetical protein